MDTLFRECLAIKVYRHISVSVRFTWQCTTWCKSNLTADLSTILDPAGQYQISEAVPECLPHVPGILGICIASEVELRFQLYVHT